VRYELEIRRARSTQGQLSGVSCLTDAPSTARRSVIVMVDLPTKRGTERRLRKGLNMSSGNHLVHPIEGQTGQHWGRRDFVKGVAALAGAAGVSAYDTRSAVADPPPETTRLTLIDDGTLCIAPVFVAEALLRSEGFAEVRYLKRQANAVNAAVAAGDADIALHFASSLVARLDAGYPLVVLAGVHAGCFELFATDERVRAIRDLKDKKVAVLSKGSAAYLFLSSMAAYVGLDPRKDIHWEEHSYTESIRVLGERKVDAFLAFPPYPQELRAKRIGHVVVNTATDSPWSQYYCCMLHGNRNFVRKNPVATKRAIRAILKATDICAQQPERAARLIVESGYAARYDSAFETLKEVPYDVWRRFDPEDTLRFYALRLHEVGMIKSTPQKIIAQGSDWRFLNELKRELKA
jgi:NitT/TauT family transport system substrate-binding protein